MRRHLFIAVILLVYIFLQGCQSSIPEQKIDLAGEWQFMIDPDDKGATEQWYLQALPEVVALPGSMAINHKGYDVDINTIWTGQVVDSSFFKYEKYARYRDPANFKVPFWLQPVKHYVGAAWYKREVCIPENWEGSYVELFLERCHWETRLWINGKEAGIRNSLGTPHIYDITDFIIPGKNVIAVCVDNRTKEIDPGINSHSISDHTQSNWNGMVGKLHIESRPKIHIRNIQVYPDTDQKKAVVRLAISGSAGESHKISIKLSAVGLGNPAPLKKNFTIDGGENIVRIEYPLGENAQLWDEFNPATYKLEVLLKEEETGKTDKRTTCFGLRDFKAEGRQLTINGHPVFLRGTLECAIFPKTGYPPTDKESWSRIIGICKAHGLNHIRFHSWCPPKAAFEAADKAGFYLQPEVSCWPNQSTTLGDGKPFDQYIYEETARMIEQYGNHPSFVLMASGNEPGGRNYRSFLAEYISHWKSVDPRRLYVSAAGWPNIDENDFMSDPAPRIQAWGAGLNSIINREPPRSDYDWSEYISGIPQPVVSHEIGQWCVYPNLKEIAKYDGVLKARNFEIFGETLAENGMAHLADSFLLASGKLQAICYKADIEAALRTKEFGGFQLLDLHDFPGQGTALVGVLDAFWDEKGYITPEQFRMFCNTTVPLARFPKHIYTNNEELKVPVEIAHFGRDPMNSIAPTWKVTGNSGTVWMEGELPATDIPIGNGTPIGEISFPLDRFNEAESLTLEVSVGKYKNCWDFWVYPVEKETIPGEQQIRVVQKFDNETISYLEEGGMVLLTLTKGSLSNEMGGNIASGFSSIFWNTAWTRGQAPHTLGIFCNPSHPALAGFPTQFHSNWQWWDAMHFGSAIDLSTISEVQAIVRVIDDWFTNRPLALLFEAKVGKGRILVSGIDFTTFIETRPEALQLLHSLKMYMTGRQFDPKVELSSETLVGLTR